MTTQQEHADTGARLTRGITISYALGSVGTAGFSTVPGLLLAYYLTNSLGVAAGVAVFVLLVPKLWDVVFLPIVGNLSDRSPAKRGTRRPFLLAGGLLLPPMFALMFAVPAGFARRGRVLGLRRLHRGGLGLRPVPSPHIATPAEITNSPRQRTTLMAWRVAFLTFGILLFGAGSPGLRDGFANVQTGYLVMGVVVGGLIGLGMLACWWGLRRAKLLDTSATERSLRAQFKVARSNPDFVVLLGTFILQALATSAMLGGAQYFATYIPERPKLTDVLFACLVAPGLLFVPVWAKLSHRVGKRGGFTIASVLFIAAALLLLTARIVPLPVVYVLVALAGIGYAGMQMFPLSMLPDTIAADTERRGTQQAGAFTGYWTAGETAAFAVGPALVLAMLAVTGFQSSTADVEVAQPASAVTGVLLSFTVLPAVLAAVSLLLLRRYRTPS